MLLELARREEGFLKFLVGGIWVSGIRVVTFESIVLALMSETTASCLCGNFISICEQVFLISHRGSSLYFLQVVPEGPPKVNLGDTYNLYLHHRLYHPHLINILLLLFSVL